MFMNESRSKAIREIWKGNAMMQTVGIKIENLTEGSVTLAMPILDDINTNHWLGLHGGALATLIDSACGIACATLGFIAQTLNLNINYISNTRGIGPVTATASVVHCGQTVIVLTVTVQDELGTRMCEASSVYFISGQLDAIS